MLTKALVCLAARAASVCGSGPVRSQPTVTAMAGPFVAVVSGSFCLAGCLAGVRCRFCGLRYVS